MGRARHHGLRRHACGDFGSARRARTRRSARRPEGDRLIAPRAAQGVKRAPSRPRNGPLGELRVTHRLKEPRVAAALPFKLLLLLLLSAPAGLLLGADP